MKSTLRTIIVSATLALFGLTAVTYTSCTEDKCKGIACAYGGTCNEGTCTCPAGYEGPQCETVNRNRYLGDWYVNEDGTISNSAQYTVSIEPAGDITHVRISNLYNNILQNIDASVKGDTLTIPRQTASGYTVQGFAALEKSPFYGVHGQMTVYYTVANSMGQIDSFLVAPNSAPSLWTK